MTYFARVYCRRSCAGLLCGRGGGVINHIGDYLAVKVDRFTKTRKSTYTGFELFSIREKAIPMDVSGSCGVLSESVCVCVVVALRREWCVCLCVV